MLYNSEAGHPVTSVLNGALSPGCSPTRRAFRPPAGGRVTFLCLSKERVTKRKDTPESAPYGCANGLRGFSTALPVLAKNWLASMPATLRAILHPFAALYGAPVKSQSSARSAHSLLSLRASRATATPHHMPLLFALCLLLCSFALSRVRALRARVPLCGE